jgi:hypothetical protein
MGHMFRKGSAVGARHVIVWDLDGTLGDFEALEKSGGDEPVRVKTRPGLAAALRSLHSAGFVHTLLTMATAKYAEIALRGTGLFELFDRVEGQGQRCKGDAAGIATAFGVPAEEVAHRMIFVGDRMMFDEPEHADVVFHLEPFALVRPAEQLERLVLRLRHAGRGSIREGFRAIGLGPRRWQRLWRRVALPVGQASRRNVDGLGSLVLLERHGECPVIGYERAPDPAGTADEHEFIPAQVLTARSP